MTRLREWFGRRLRGTRAPIREVPPYYLLLAGDEAACPWCSGKLDDTAYYPYCSRDCGTLAAVDNRRG